MSDLRTSLPGLTLKTSFLISLSVPLATSIWASSSFRSSSG